MRHGALRGAMIAPFTIHIERLSFPIKQHRAAAYFIAVSPRRVQYEVVAEKWVEVAVEVPHEHADAVANFLIESGAPGLVTNTSGATTILTAHYSSSPPLDSLKRFCAAIDCDGPFPLVRTQTVAEQDWAENWKQHFEPLLVGDQLFVCPPWRCIAPPGRLAVVINPGMAFGTGHHASTRGSLVLLERNIRRRHVARALDVGTGSGILAIAMLKLGVNDVWAIDIDPLACQITAINAAVNEVDDRLHIAATWDACTGPFDLIVANLFATLLIERAPCLSRSIAAGGTLICSGLLAPDEGSVRRAYQRLGLTVVARFEESAWVTLDFANKG